MPTVMSQAEAAFCRQVFSVFESNDGVILASELIEMSNEMDVYFSDAQLRGIEHLSELAEGYFNIANFITIMLFSAETMEQTERKFHEMIQMIENVDYRTLCIQHIQQVTYSRGDLLSQSEIDEYLEEIYHRNPDNFTNELYNILKSFELD